MSAPVRAASSSRRYHSAELRARRETSSTRTRPTSPSPTADTSRANPSRSCAAALPAPLLPWSSSMTLDLLGRPAQALRPLGQRVLAPGALRVALDLGGAGLADVDERLPRQVARGDLRLLGSAGARAGLAAPARVRGRRALDGDAAAGMTVMVGSPPRPAPRRPRRPGRPVVHLSAGGLDEEPHQQAAVLRRKTLPPGQAAARRRWAPRCGPRLPARPRLPGALRLCASLRGPSTHRPHRASLRAGPPAPAGDARGRRAPGGPPG